MKTKMMISILLIPLCYLLSNAQVKNLPTTITGSWDVWIPGAVTYHQKSDAIYQRYEPGAAMRTLKINNKGSFEWGNSKGSLQEVRPWYAEDSKRYFRIQDLSKNTYDLWYKESTDELILLFGEVGGHAATGTRIGKRKIEDAKPKEKPKPIINDQKVNSKPKEKESQNSNTYQINDKVEVIWSSAWYQATVLEVKDGKYLIRYDGWGKLYDEWVIPDRIRRKKQ
ncbi:agenet domain-containing protein [Sphingobacterium kyonggiense]